MKRFKIKHYWTYLKKIYHYINGDFSYDNYCKHLKIKHPTQKPLEKKLFLKDLQKRKWDKINRCC